MKLLLFLFFLACSPLQDIKARLESQSQDVSSTVFQNTCDEDCLLQCKNLFVEDSEVKLCGNLSSNEVTLIERADKMMKRGNWKALDRQHLRTMTRVSHAPWLRYVGVNV